MAPKLSICIPTYNRAEYLDKVLAHLYIERPISCDFEVIVANNHSEDHTEDVLRRWEAREPGLRVWRQTRNVGPANNVHCAYRIARGEYLIYLADDDRLIPGRVDDVVRTLDNLPDVVVALAPWEVQNERTGQSYGTHYQVPEDRIFTKTASIDLLNYIFNGHIFPEIAVYRAGAMHKMAPMPFRAYWAFVLIVELLDLGDVLFMNKPFYLFNVPADTGPKMRRTAGGEGIVNDRDSYQAGLEYLVLKCFSHVADGEMQQVPVVRQMIEQFMDLRLVGAKDALIREHNWRGIYEFVVRMRARGLITRNDGQRLDQEMGLRSRASIQAFLQIFDAMTGLDAVAIAGYADSAEVIARISEQRPGMPVQVIRGAMLNADAPIVRVLILAGPATDKAGLLAAGCLPGAIIDEADLLRQFAA